MKKFTLWLLFAFVALVANAGNFSVYLKIDGTYVKESSSVYVYLWNTDEEMKWDNKPQVTEKDIVMDVDGAKYFKYSFSDKDDQYSFLFICDDKQSCDIGKEPNFVKTDMVITYNGKKVGDKYDYNYSTIAPVEPASVYLKGEVYGWKDNNGVKLEYNPKDKTYVYTETTTTNLASNFKIWIDGGWYRYGDYISWNLSKNENNIRTYAEIKTFADENNMKIEDAANFSSITIKVKKDGNAWKMQVEGTPTGGGGSEGEKDHTVTMKGAAWSWSADKFTFTKQDDGTYAYTFTGNDKAGLAQEFAFTIDGVDYCKRIDLEVNTDVAYPMATDQFRMNYTIPKAADYRDITLTVKFTDGTPSLKVTGTEDENHTVTMKGAAWGNWESNKFTFTKQDDGTYAYTFTGDNKAGLAQEFAFTIDGKDDYSYRIDLGVNTDEAYTMATGQSGYNYKIPTAANYTDITLTVAFSNGTPSLKVTGTEDTSGVESIDNEGVKIVAGKGTITVSGATNVEVYTAGGALVSREAESHVAAGLYIVRTDNKVAKVIVR